VLGIDPSRIRVLQVYEGSVVINFDIAEAEPPTPPPVEPEEPEDEEEEPEEPEDPEDEEEEPEEPEEPEVPTFEVEKVMLEEMLVTEL